ncbi:E3 SUMO-protein ligase NSE2-like [Drosophila nasuta]|uniref:E3 SUMO-protein ligase NSE2-like n=1 Tax=Drosophila nasuta TaxID=42062 RepID=UPI00295F0B59|nr:E3 SUMO-protein ligase NSE2-like [Drosophila nasuta]
MLSEFADFKQEMLNCPSTSHADDNTEIVEDDTNVFSMYDPWTKGLMLNPVRNKNCGHHYDRDSVMAAIKDSLSVKCPIVGCVSNIFVQHNHLVSNEALKQRIHTYKAQQGEEVTNDDN